MQGAVDSTVLERRFRGQARLVRLLLWKIGESTDIEAALDEAVRQSMIDTDDALFLKDCLNAEERDRDSDHLEIIVSEDMVSHLQRCADRLNRADSA